MYLICIHISLPITRQLNAVPLSRQESRCRAGKWIWYKFYKYLLNVRSGTQDLSPTLPPLFLMQRKKCVWGGTVGREEIGDMKKNIKYIYIFYTNKNQCFHLFF